MSDPRPFSLTEARYDQTTFLGRLRHFVEFTNPALLLTSDAQYSEMKDRLDQFQNGTLPSTTTDEELWRAKYAVGGSFAKDGEKIPIPFRMCGYAFGNIPIVVGLMIPSSSLATLAFWQWGNQTQNALLAHYNRPSVEPLPMDKFLPAYGGAVGTAITIALAARKVVTSISSETLRATMTKSVPFVSVASANVANTYLMRKHEIDQGIDLYDEKGKKVGISKMAAKKAVYTTCITRAFLSLLVLGPPAWIIPSLEKTALLKANPRLNMPMQFMVAAAALFIVVPVSVSPFSEKMTVPSSDLEPEFAKKYAGKMLNFSKGL